MLAELRQWFDARRSKIKDDYFQFLRFRSVATDPAYAAEVQKCAEWLSHYLRQGGLHAELLATPTYPIVFVDEPGEKERAVLAYGHYDVQPVDPIELWESDPFEPTERDGKVFARGACDDKGQIFYAILAAIAWKELRKRLPVRLKFCIEGEEESHSRGLLHMLPRLKDKFAADDLIVVDLGQLAEGMPSISLGARGMAALEVVLTGSTTDLHSGSLGGVAYNPNRALAELLAQLWDEEGRVRVPGFYDDVVEETGEYTYPYTQGYFAKEFGIEAIGGEKGRLLQEANWTRPTLEINGMGGGYTGAGVKTVIPAKAVAKLSMRLVPKQQPDALLRSLQEYVQRHVKQGMQVECISHGGEAAWRGDLNSHVARALGRAVEEVTGHRCAKILAGGSIPVVTEMLHVLRSQVVGMGFGLPSDKIHAPNEHFDMKRVEQGFLTFAQTLAYL